MGIGAANLAPGRIQHNPLLGVFDPAGSEIGQLDHVADHRFLLAVVPLPPDDGELSILGKLGYTRRG